MTDGYATETRAGERGPVVVRTATTAPARRLLDQERRRLDRSRHPGVVKLLAASDDELTIAWAGAQTLELLAAPIPALCGVLTSVASTVADLHEIGMIHGRLDASHVVIDADGRPRLCGMRGPAADERNPLPTDDVAAIGALIDHLMGSDTEIEPIPERRWSRRRWTGYQRRALQLVADQATHDDPACRPTARELAAAIAEAVPDAQLMPPARRTEPLPPPVQATSPEPKAQAAPTEAHQTTSPSPTADKPVRPISTLPSPPPPPPPAVPPAVEVAALQPAESPTPRPVGALPADPPPPTFLGLRIEAPIASNQVSRSNSNSNSNSDPEVEPEHQRTPTRPRPPTPISRRPVPLAMAAAIAALVGIVVWGVGFRNSSTPANRGALSAPTPTATTVPLATRTSLPATTDPTPTRCSPSGPSTGPDLEGDSCPDLVEINGTRVTVAGVNFEVGEPGDRVEVADWNCDGRSTAAIVRPGTGEIFVFSEWVAAEEPLTVTPATVVPGAVSLVAPDEDPCTTHHLVRLVGGTTTPVDLQAQAP